MIKHTFDWNDIDTVLLDMDGTLLDLYFDNYFWLEYLPGYWGEINGLDTSAAKKQLTASYGREKGTLSWYCLDFWSRQLNIDVLQLKYDVEHLIQFRPFAQEFLAFLAKSDKQLIMVTNAHQKLIALKQKKTGIVDYFDRIICAHDLGFPKEEIDFWQALDRVVEFNRSRTILIDDNLTVLRAARSHGIGYLLSIARPDSNSPAQDTEEFTAIHCFRELAAGF
ncbi:MAG: GMP/IMP nucleotidase [Gammaproteobacteria bacterium]|jgi:putative hydrolase of the HAD superfamily